MNQLVKLDIIIFNESTHSVLKWKTYVGFKLWHERQQVVHAFHQKKLSPCIKMTSLAPWIRLPQCEPAIVIKREKFPPTTILPFRCQKLLAQHVPEDAGTVLFQPKDHLHHNDTRITCCARIPADNPVYRRCQKAESNYMWTRRFQQPSDIRKDTCVFSRRSAAQSIGCF